MLVDFQTIDLNDKPVLVLKAPSGKVLQTLGFAHNLECQFRFNEVSQISFEVPAYVNGELVPNYDKVVGEMIVDMVDWGQFILQNPKTENDGVKEVKTCTAYSLEYELTHKQFVLEEGTYNFWNPASPEGTILWLITECCPGWTVGSVDSGLVGKYRTFDSTQDNVYNTMMNTLQKPYKCVFYFDTYNKKIHAVDATNDAVSSPVFLSLDNLVKKIDIDEKSENLVTVLDVNGAEDVDIRSVNPLGTNKIYNLDYFMNSTHFDQAIITAWNNWKELFEERRQEYFSLSVRRAMKTTEILTLRARLADEQGQLSTYENEQAVNIQASLNGDATGQIAQKLEELKESVDEQTAIVAVTTSEIEALQTANESILTALQAIIDEVSFENNFTEDQLAQLQPYFIEDSIAESAFAMVDTTTFVDSSTTVTDKDITVNIQDCDLMEIAPRSNGSGGTLDEQIYSFTNGSLSLTYSSTSTTYEVTGEINRGSAERNGTKLVVTVALGSGAINNVTSGTDVKFNKGTLALVGTYNSITDDTTQNENTPNVIYEGKSLTCRATAADMYITNEVTMLEQYAVEWDLYEYGEEQLKKLAYPTYTFKLDTSNFLALADFVDFTRALTLGRKSYLDIGTEVLQPILIGVDISFEELSSLSLVFSDTYNGGNNAFDLVDLLEQSVSMGHKLDVSKFSYNDYVNSGAKTAVQNFITSALDASKNAVINGRDQSVVFDKSGLKLRKASSSGGYEDEQIWMINNNIVFTEDGWETAKMAIGRFTDTNAGDCWGIVAPNIVGTLIAGENLVIESPKTNITGGPSATSLFRVDEDGVSMYNSRLEIINPLTPDSSSNPRYGIILLDPDLGMGLGSYTGNYSTVSSTNNDAINGLVQTHNGQKQWNTDNTTGQTVEQGRVNFWVDMDGNLHFRGTLEGADGVFTGSMKVGAPESGAGLYLDGNGNLAIGGMYSPYVWDSATNKYVKDTNQAHTPKANFYVTNSGDMFAMSGKFEGDMYVDNLYFKDDNNNWASVLDDHNKINSQYLDLGNIIIDGTTGDISMSGNLDLSDLSSIHFGSFNPYVYNYSADGTNWHSTKAATDKYYRISYDGGTTWTDTMNMARDWPNYIQDTYLDLQKAVSPCFMGNEMYAIDFNVVPSFSQNPQTGDTSHSTPVGKFGYIPGWDGTYVIDDTTGDYVVDGNNDYVKNFTTGVGIKTDDTHYVICTTLGERMQTGQTDYNNVTGWSSLVSMSDQAYMAAGRNLYVGLQSHQGLNRVIGGYYIASADELGALNSRTDVSTFSMSATNALVQHIDSTASAGRVSTKLDLSDTYGRLGKTDESMYFNIGVSELKAFYSDNVMSIVGDGVYLQANNGVAKTSTTDDHVLLEYGNVGSTSQVIVNNAQIELNANGQAVFTMAKTTGVTTLTGNGSVIRSGYSSGGTRIGAQMYVPNGGQVVVNSDGAWVTFGSPTDSFVNSSSVGHKLLVNSVSVYAMDGSTAVDLLNPPTKLSQFENDTGFQNASQVSSAISSALSGYATQSYVTTAINNASNMAVFG